MRRSTWLVIIAAASSLAGQVHAPPDAEATARKPPPTLQLAFEVRARDASVGQGRLLVGGKSTNKRGAVRAVVLEGKTAPLLGLLGKGEAETVTWVGQDWVPVQSRWRSQVGARAAQGQVRYDKDRVQGTVLRAGQSVTVDKQGQGPILDITSLIPWLVQQPRKPGTQLVASLYTGLDLCRLSGTVQPVAVVSHGTTTRDAVPIQLQMSDCRHQRDLTVWLDAKDGTPLRLRLADKLLGAIELVLTSVERTRGPALPQPPEEAADAVGPEKADAVR